MSKIKIFQSITILLLSIILISCNSNEKESEGLTMIIDKEARVEGNPYSEKGLRVKGPVELKGDHKVEYDSISSTAKLMNLDGDIHGTFNCGCMGGEGGGCKLITRPNVMSCQHTICNDCVMEIVIHSPDTQLNIAYR